MIHNKYTTKGLKKGGKDITPLGLYLGQELSSAETAKDGLKPRWKLNEQVNRNDKKVAGIKIFDNYEPRPTATMSPRIRRIVNVTISDIAGPSPMLQAVPDDKDQVGADALETALHLTWELARFTRKLRSGLETTALCGLSLMRMRMLPTGIKFDYIHPNDIVVAPLFVQDLRDAHLVGHRFYLPRWKVKERAKSKFYPLLTDEEIDKLSIADPDDDPSGRDPAYDRTTNEDSGVIDNQLVELWELIVRLEVDGNPQYMRVVYNQDDEKLLLIEKYIYSRPWYFDLRFHDEPGKFYPASSVAQNIIGLCLQKGDMLNLLAAGSMATAVNPVVIAGSGSLGKKLKHYNIGMIIEVPYSDVNILEIPLNFDPGAMPGVMDIIDQQLEAETGITDHRLAAERKSGDITATQISAEEQASQQNEGAYAAFVSDFIEEIAYLWQEFLGLHPSAFREAYGDAIPEEVYGLARNKVRWLVAGRNPGNSPHILIGKLESALNYALNVPNSPVSAPKLVLAILNSLQLPINVESILKDDEEIAQERDEAMALAQLEAQGQAPSGGDGGLDGGLGPQAGVGVPNGLA